MELMNVDCFSATTDMCSVLQGKYEPAALQELLENAYFLDPRYRDDYINDTETKYKLKEMAAVENGGRTASASVLGDEGQAVVLKSRTTSASVPIPKRAGADNQLMRYLQEECIESTANPLSWWRYDQSRYLLLSKVACK